MNPVHAAAERNTSTATENKQWPDAMNTLDWLMDSNIDDESVV